MVKSNMESANTNLKDRIASDSKAYSKALDYCFFLSSQIQRTNVSLVMNKVIMKYHNDGSIIINHN